jgi:hypothetical protein
MVKLLQLPIKRHLQRVVIRVVFRIHFLQVQTAGFEIYVSVGHESENGFVVVVAGNDGTEHVTHGNF